MTLTINGIANRTKILETRGNTFTFNLRFADHGQSTEYVWVGGTPVAVLKKSGGGPAKLYYILTDHLGTPRQVADSRSNAVVWEWFGEPFGTSVPDQDPGKTGEQFTLNLRYAGQYYDRESGHTTVSGTTTRSSGGMWRVIRLGWGVASILMPM